MIAERLRAPRLLCSFCSQIPTKITAKKFHPKGNTIIPRFWNNADKPGQDRWVEEMLDVPPAVFITRENLCHWAWILCIGFPLRALVAVENNIGFHKVFGCYRLDPLRSNSSYLLNCEEINLQPLLVVVWLGSPGIYLSFLIDTGKGRLPGAKPGCLNRWGCYLSILDLSIFHSKWQRASIYFTAKELHAKSRFIVGLFWVDSDISCNYRGINDVLFYTIGIRITFKNLF